MREGERERCCKCLLMGKACAGKRCWAVLSCEYNDFVLNVPLVLLGGVLCGVVGFYLLFSFILCM